MSRSSARARSVDLTVYPEEERVGESMQQRRIAELLRPLLQWWLNVCRGVVAFVGADQFIYWRQYHPHARIAPDVYVMHGVEPDTEVKSWKLWIDGSVPSFALEIVSEEWEKDYEEAPIKYQELGVPEVVIFDPGYELHRDGVRWQVYRRLGKRGLLRVEATNGDRVRSRSLGCWLRAVGEGKHLRLRIAEGRQGERLVPTSEERAEAERTAKEAALARVAKLEAALRRRKSDPGRR
jgi:hypothetical protein